MPQSQLPLWVQYAQALGAPLLAVVIAGVGAWVALQQVRIARVRLQHDLYDRRFAVFEAARKFLAEVLTQRYPSDDHVRSYVVGTADAGFLLNDDVAAYLEEIRKRGSRLGAIEVALKPLPVGNERTAFVQQEEELFSWMMEQTARRFGREVQTIPNTRTTAKRLVGSERGAATRSWRLFAVQRALALALALAVSIHAVNASEISLKCRVINSNYTQQLTIDLDNRWLAFGKKANGTASEWFDIIKVSDLVITAILKNPRIVNGEEIFVLNRDTGQYVQTNVSLSCTDKKCLSQAGPTVDTFSGNCRPPIL